MENTPIIIERSLDQPVARVWQAITDPEAMKQWYFDLPGFRPVVGYAFEFDGGTEENTYRHLCVVTEAVEWRKLTYSWRYDGYPGISYVTFELFPESNKTRLRLTHTGLETFPAENPDFARKNFEAGWTDIIGTLLPNYLQSTLTAAP